MAGSGVTATHRQGTKSAVTAKKFGDSAFEKSRLLGKSEIYLFRTGLKGMAPRMDDVVRLCCEISAHDQIKVAVKNSAKGAIKVTGTAVVGGMLGGPPGLAVGAAVGGLLSWLTSGEFRPLPQILMELPPAQRQKLYDQVASVLDKLDWMDAAQLIALVMGNPTLQQQVKAALLNYVTKELQAEVR